MTHESVSRATNDDSRGKRGALVKAYANDSLAKGGLVG